MDKAPAVKAFQININVAKSTIKLRIPSIRDVNKLSSVFSEIQETYTSVYEIITEAASIEEVIYERNPYSPTQIEEVTASILSVIKPGVPTESKDKDRVTIDIDQIDNDFQQLISIVSLLGLQNQVFELKTVTQTPTRPRISVGGTTFGDSGIVDQTTSQPRGKEQTLLEFETEKLQPTMPQSEDNSDNNRRENENPSSTASVIDSKNIVFKKPSTFDGENKNAREWLNEYRLCSKANGWDEKKQVQLLPVYLSNEAADWYDMDVSNKLTTMDEIQKAFIKQFSGTTEVADIEYRIDTARQKDDEIPYKFILKMRTLFQELKRATGKETEERVILDKIKTRLNPSYTAQVFAHNPRTLEELHELCARIHEGKQRQRGKVPITNIVERKESKNVGKTQESPPEQNKPTSSKPGRFQLNPGSNQKPDRHFGNERRREPRKATREDVCHYCKKNGHFARDCYKKKRDMGASRDKKDNVRTG